MTNNPQFPDRVIISRTIRSGDSSPSAGSPLGGTPSPATMITTVLINTHCDNYRNSNKNKEGVTVSDYTLEMAATDIVFQAGDDVEVHTHNRILKGKLKDFDYFNFGTTIWWNKSTNE